MKAGMILPYVYTLLAVAFPLFLSSSGPTVLSAEAEGSKFESSYEKSGIADGEFGLRIGTEVYNLLNPDHPLPVTKGDVIQDTLRNIGSGMSVSEAFIKAADEDSGLNKKILKPTR